MTVVQTTTVAAAVRDEVEKVKVPVFQGRPRRATVPGDPADPVVAWSPFALLLVVALGLLARSLWQGEWWIVAGSCVIVAIAGWGLYLSRRPVDAARPCPQPIVVTTTEAAEGLPVIGSFTITGQINSTTTATTGRLSLILPAELEVTAEPVLAALLTTGHQILHDHHLTQHLLPIVEVTMVDRAQEQPTTFSGPGFTVHITNDPATRHSTITMDTHHLTGPENPILLIAATLLAGAEHLLDNPTLSFPTPPPGAPTPEPLTTTHLVSTPRTTR